MQNKAQLFLILSVTLLAALLTGCAERQHPLLEPDPAAMTDSALVRYYHELGQAIEECEAENQGGTQVRVGTGTGTGGTWGGVSVSHTVGRVCDATPLRQRRVDVRLELRRRDIEP